MNQAIYVSPFSWNMIKYLKDGRMAIFNHKVLYGTVSIWDLKTATNFEFKTGLHEVMEELSSGFLAASSKYAILIRIWNLQNGSSVYDIPTSLPQPALKQLKTCNFLASGDTKGVINLWKANTFELTDRIFAHTNLVLSLEEYKKGLLISYGDDSYIKISSIKRKKVISSFFMSQSISDLKISGTAEFIATSGIKLYKMSIDGQQNMNVKNLINLPQGIVSLRVSNDGIVIVALTDYTFIFYNLTSLMQIYRYPGERSAYYIYIPSKLTIILILKIFY